MEYNQHNNTLLDEEEFEETYDVSTEDSFEYEQDEDNPEEIENEGEGHAEVDLTDLVQLYERVKGYAQEHEVDLVSKIENTKEELKELHKLQSTDYVKYEIDEHTQQLQFLEQEFVEKNNIDKNLVHIKELLGEDISVGYEEPYPDEDIYQDEVFDGDSSRYDAYDMSGAVLERHLHKSENHENAIQAVESFLNSYDRDISDNVQAIHFVPEKETSDSENREVMDKRSDSITDQVTAIHKLHKALLTIWYVKGQETRIRQEQENLEAHSDDIEDWDEDILSESPVPIIRKHLIGHTNQELALYMQKHFEGCGVYVKPIVPDEETAEDMGTDPDKVSEYLVYIDTDEMLDQNMIDRLIDKFKRSEKLYEKRVNKKSNQQS